MKKLTPVEEVNLQAIEKIERSLVRSIIEKRDHQAYTSLVEGIEGMIKHDIEIPRPEYYFNRGEIGVYEHQQALNHWMEQEARNQALTDILENVVKPLYRKE